MEEIQARHRKEQRDLQSRITQKKKNATKKTRKGVNDECERLEYDLLQRQKAELDAINDSGSTEPVLGDADDDDAGTEVTENGTANGIDKVEMAVSKLELSETPPSQQPSQIRKPNRQKARMARRAAEQGAEAAAAAVEAAGLPDLREQELSAMKTQLAKHGLQETQVRPDGHCLYSACALGIAEDQARKTGPFSEPYKNMRYITAAYISQHPGDFAPFLEEPLNQYVKKISDTAEWGGQPELLAIARSLKLDINVLRSNGDIEKITPEEGTSPKKTVWLAYYKHSFGLGEHYNALSPKATT